MDDLRFNSLNELYLRVYPSLKSKVEELKLLGIHSITEKDIWNYFSSKNWSANKSLSLHDIVDDIITLDIDTASEISDLKKSVTSREA